MTYNVRRARQLRNNMTEAERHLWSALRRRQRLGCKFRRQAPIGGYIADFACFAPPLVVELDGESHDQTAGHDRTRDRRMRARGFAVLRFQNDDVRANLEGVVAAIDDALRRLLAVDS